MSLDPVTVVVRTLLEDDSVSAAVSGRIFGGFIPPDSLTPLILVRSISRRPTTAPTTQWWDLTVSADVHAVDPAESFQIACAVEAAVNAVVGGQPEGVVAYSEAQRITPVEDGAWTPTRYRNVVTVQMTARSI
jgi:hypothetical protein